MASTSVSKLPYGSTALNANRLLHGWTHINWDGNDVIDIHIFPEMTGPIQAPSTKTNALSTHCSLFQSPTGNTDAHGELQRESLANPFTSVYTSFCQRERPSILSTLPHSSSSGEWGNIWAQMTAGDTITLGSSSTSSCNLFRRSSGRVSSGT